MATSSAHPRMINAAGCAATRDAFAASEWGGFFITHDPPHQQRSEEWMRERVEELKGRVRTMFSDNDSVAKAVTLIDTLERLGVDGHFREEIASAISRIVHPDESSGSDDLHVVATRFRLLRQHGIWVSTDVLEKFRDDMGNFRASLSSDPRALLSLYNAAHMVVSGDGPALEEAIDFTRHQLEAIAAKGELRSPVAEQIARALDHPLPRFTRLLESMYYVGEYAQEETHNNTLLELARLNSHLMRYLHLRELKALSLWWRDLYDMVNLPYTRDRMVEVYFWSCGMIPEEEYSRARLMFAKTFGLVTFLDDTYDVHATLEECRSFTEAIERWDDSAVSILPEYLRVLYIKTLSNFKDFENMLKPHEKYRMSYAKKAYQLQAEYYMQEAQWSHDKHQPTFREHEELSVMSSGLPMLNLVALMGYGAIATNKVFEWTCAVPDVVRAGAQIGRFLNDISSYKLGKNKKDVASVVESYMVEKGTTGEEAVAAIAAMTEDSWRMMNQACMYVDRALLPAAQLVVNIARSNEVIYLRGRDGYTFGSHVKDLVTMLFLAPIPL
ncbi:eudesmanediol synthase-like [Hordeum vulgare subsp. vulgare]|uniref:Terpene synthase n=1 Tax=Hordeum vulgare subsp. vulgare TaxID=112509 RepID=A0A8I6WN07_HORVV|nr:eudesmanediol synthase-like [Hordeum vulgare subsp. vulgare]